MMDGPHTRTVAVLLKLTTERAIDDDGMSDIALWIDTAMSTRGRTVESTVYPTIDALRTDSLRPGR
jgi:hypothetical protein